MNSRLVSHRIELDYGLGKEYKGLVKLGEICFETIGPQINLAAAGSAKATPEPGAPTKETGSETDDSEYDPSEETPKKRPNSKAPRKHAAAKVKPPTGKQWRFKKNLDGVEHFDGPHVRVVVTNFGATTGRGILCMGNSTKVSSREKRMRN